jgi:predicted metal-dependent hydrolase
MHMFETGRPNLGSAIMPVTIEGVDCPIEIRRSARAKRLSLKVSHTRRAAILTMPERSRAEDASAFIARHLDWLKCQTGKLPRPIALCDGAIMPLRGIIHRLEFAGHSLPGAGVVSLSEHDGTAVWSGALLAPHTGGERHQPSTTQLRRLVVSGEEHHAPRRLGDWLRAQARQDLSQRVAHHASRLQVRPKRISVRDQATRWGSCSTTGTLSFSWRLIFAPGFVVDYVAAHEVAHMREMNHGPRFWRLVKDTMPEMNTARRWLRDHGAELHRFQV